MQTDEFTDRHGDDTDADARLRGPFEAVSDTDTSDVLDALTDPICREVLGYARTPVTARDVAADAGLSMSTTYRKLESLTEAGLLETQTELRDDGYHTTRYRATLEAATIRFDEDEDVHVTFERTPENQT